MSSLGVDSGHLTMPLDALAAGLGDHTVRMTLCPLHPPTFEGSAGEIVRRARSAQLSTWERAGRPPTSCVVVNVIVMFSSVFVLTRRGVKIGAEAQN